MNHSGEASLQIAAIALRCGARFQVHDSYVFGSERDAEEFEKQVEKLLAEVVHEPS